MSITILGIESSCDDTSAAVIRDEVMLSNVIASQAVHEAYGGLFLNWHLGAPTEYYSVVSEALKRAGVTPEDLSAVAFTRGPDLWVFARRNFFCQRFYDSIEYSSRRCQSFASSCYGSFYQTSPDDNTQPSFPFLCLLVSGEIRKSLK